MSESPLYGVEPIFAKEILIQRVYRRALACSSEASTDHVVGQASAVEAGQNELACLDFQGKS